MLIHAHRVLQAQYPLSLPNSSLISVHHVNVFLPCSCPAFHSSFKDIAFHSRVVLCLDVVGEPACRPVAAAAR